MTQEIIQKAMDAIKAAQSVVAPKSYQGLRIEEAITYLDSALKESPVEGEALEALERIWCDIRNYRTIQDYELERVKALQAQLDKLTKALENINANASDAGDSKGKTGADWIAAICREISEEALTDKEESDAK